MGLARKLLKVELSIECFSGTSACLNMYELLKYNSLFSLSFSINVIFLSGCIFLHSSDANGGETNRSNGKIKKRCAVLSTSSSLLYLIFFIVVFSQPDSRTQGGSHCTLHRDSLKVRIFSAEKLRHYT